MLICNLFLLCLTLTMCDALHKEANPSSRLTQEAGIRLSSTKESSLRIKNVIGQVPKSKNKPTVDFGFYSNYPAISEYYKKWKKLALDYPDIIRYRMIGISSKGREIVLLEIGNTSTSSPKRIFVNALQVPRDWISVTSLTFVAESLAVNWHHRDEILTLLSIVQILLIPMVNPDGYARTFNRGHRAWQKNLRDPPTSVPSGCENVCEDGIAGVQLDRNWEVDFAGEHSTSHFPCEDLYHGPFPFSEEETKSLKELIENTVGIKAHLDFQSSGQVVLGPWAYSSKLTNRAKELDIVGNALSSSMGKSGRAYRYSRGSEFELEYAASGTMSDWVFSQGILSFRVQLPTILSANYNNRCRPNKTEILSSGKEALDAITTISMYALDSSKFLRDNDLKDKDTSKTESTEVLGEQRRSIIPFGFIVAFLVSFLLILTVSVVQLGTQLLIYRSLLLEREQVLTNQSQQNSERDSRIICDSMFADDVNEIENLEHADPATV